ncbi:MAG: hypothetical protein M1833_000240 [Piccolia ochrophora]|nr:MAG: hypothetical protein M1833_000240 [Piccolia ochrophora]
MRDRDPVVRPPTRGKRDTDEGTAPPPPFVLPSSNKRLHSTRSSTQQLPQARLHPIVDAEERESRHDVEPEEPHAKRSRRTSWPLKYNESTGRFSSQVQEVASDDRKRNVSPFSPSPDHGDGLNTLARSSRFQEGSMNDRVSNRPPKEFVGARHTNNHNEQNDGYDQHKLTDRSGSATHQTVLGGNLEDHDSSSSSGIFRFGRSLAAAFNPFHVWGRRVPTKSLVRDSKLMDERRARAEKTYAELKANGQFQKNVTKWNRDSGIDVDSYNNASGESGTEVQEQTHDQLLKPFAEVKPERGRSISPAPRAESARGGKFRIKTPSLMSLKKTRSELSLPMEQPRSSSRSAALDEASASTTTLPFLLGSDSAKLQKQPSRKDLQKQQKLSKRVSDLECKLETARRELKEARGNAPTLSVVSPGARQTFIPGALPSLPSQVVFSQSAGPSTLQSDSVPNITAAGPSGVGASESDEELCSPNRSSSKPNTLRRTKRKRSKTSKLIAGNPDEAKRERHVLVQNHGDEEQEVPNTTQKKRKLGSKGGKRPHDTYVRSPFAEQSPVGEERDLDRKRRLGPDPSRNGSASIMSAPHLNKSTPSLCGSSHNISPTKLSQDAFPHRSASPPPSLSYSKPTSRQSSVHEELPVSVTPDNEEVPPVPKLPQGLERIVRLANAESSEVESSGRDIGKLSRRTRLSVVKDDFEWPDDCF